ncbi:uncharacterized protein LOC113791516 [Dermatophagoides pteronyssinus]|uniref:uncharacterized protein LOC113791516 n=1 Tax=Dermatophagoides pteronyssinus TaxID=6956 RepID=UPI003F67A100
MFQTNFEASYFDTMELVDRTENIITCRFDRSSRYRSCCLCIQFYFSYVLGVFSSLIIAIAMIQFFQTLNQQWLILIGAGLLFIIIGASIYRNGVLRLEEYCHHRRRSMIGKRDRSKRCKRKTRESHIFESHLSINMLPQCFTSLDITSSTAMSSQRQQQHHANSSRPLMLLPIDAQQMLNDHINRDLETVVDVHGDHNLQQQPSMSITQSTNVTTESNTSTITNNELESCTELIFENESTNNSSLIEHDNVSSMNDRLHLISQEQTISGSGSDSEDLNANNDIEAPPSYDDVITDCAIYRTL